MFKAKIFLSIIIFSILLIATSIVKNQSRKIEKKILHIEEIVNSKEKDLNDTQLDFSYLSSPSVIEEKIAFIDKDQYFPMEYSKIFLDLSSFINLQNKFVIQLQNNEKKTQKK